MIGRRPRSAAARRYAEAPVAAPGTPWHEASYCVVDLELSDLDPRRGEVVAWATVGVDAGRIRCGSAAEGLVRPTRDLPDGSVLVHGLRDVDLAGARPLAEATDALLDAMAGRVLVAHCAWVERAFLARALRARGIRLRGPVVDTSALGRLWLGGQGVTPLPRALALSGLAARLGLPEHRPHEASGDALTTAQVFLALASHLAAQGPETVGGLALAAERADLLAG